MQQDPSVGMELPPKKSFKSSFARQSATACFVKRETATATTGKAETGIMKMVEGQFLAADDHLRARFSLSTRTVVVLHHR